MTDDKRRDVEVLEHAATAESLVGPSVRFGRWRMRLPRMRAVRIAMGGLMVLFGLFGFLPVLGYWMVPFGLVILSVDIPIARRWNRRLSVWMHRKFPRFMQTISGGSPAN